MGEWRRGEEGLIARGGRCGLVVKPPAFPWRVDRTARAPGSRLFGPGNLGRGHRSSLAVGTVSAHYRVTLAEVVMFDQLLILGVLLFFYGILVGTA